MKIRKFSGWFAGISRLLISTAVFSLILLQGLYWPNEAQAAITVQQDWTNPLNAASDPGTVAYTVNAGSLRVLTVALTRVTDATATQTCSVTYGGQAMIKVAGANDETANSQQHTWFFYLNDSGISAASGSNLVFTCSGGTVMKSQVFAAVFTGVDQSAPVADAQNYNSGTSGNTTPTFGTSLTVNDGEQAVGLLMSTRTGNVNARAHTAGANWSPFVQDVTETTTVGTRGSIANRTITTVGTESTVGGVSSATSTVVSMSAISLKVYTASTPSSISSCSGCHGYTADFADGTARNTPEGTFPGSHGMHVVTNGIACSACHAAPATETNADYKHRNGYINMANPIYSGTGSYSKASSPTYSFAQSNTFTGGTCNSIYCHSSGQGTTASNATPVYASTPPTWGGAVACGDCHATTGMSTGSHTTHINSAGATCGDCHTGATPTSYASANHVNGSIDVADSYTAGGAAGNGYGTCSTASCHVSAYGTGNVVSPTWGTAAGCGSCHPIAADGAPATGSHAKHIDTVGAACGDCHNGATKDVSGGAAHLDGNIDVIDGYPANVTKHTAGSGYSTCSTAPCHVSAYGTGNVVSPTWGTAAGCGACHPIAADGAPATGSHAIHIDSAGAVCSNCHSGATKDVSGGAAHLDGNIDVINGYPANVTKHASGTYTGSCSTATCHVSAYGSGNVTSPIWGTAAGCGACHPVNATTGAPATGSHDAHLLAGKQCGDCHAGAVKDSSGGSQHTDGNIDVAVGSYPTNITKHASGSGYSSCSTAPCHGTATWGGPPMDCISCHSASLAKTLGGGGTIRQVVGSGGDFNMAQSWSSLQSVGASRHLFGATTIVKWDCIVCHMEGQEQTGATQGKTNSAYHNEGSGATGGKINLRNVDNPTTGWAIDNKAWSTTDYANLDQFCVTCHDTDGAAGINVNGTTGLNLGNTNALTPFNSTDVVSGTIKGSTELAGNERLRVTDVKNQFYAGTNGPGASYNGNPSQHAVLGQRYSTVNANWTAAAWVTNLYLKKWGKNLGVDREASMLTCADCHVLDSASGAHGGSTRYNLEYAGSSASWSTLTQPGGVCARCHNATVYTSNSSASRFNHSYSRSATVYGYPGSGAANRQCLFCHASWDGTSTVTRQNSYGGIHGSWSSTATFSSGSTIGAYRFFPGAWRKGNYTLNGDNMWTSTATFGCYFNASGTGFTSCTSHANRNGGNYTPSYGRPTKY